jgi:hypothetical protein
VSKQAAEYFTNYEIIGFKEVSTGWKTKANYLQKIPFQ